MKLKRQSYNSTVLKIQNKTLEKADFGQEMAVSGKVKRDRLK